MGYVIICDNCGKVIRGTVTNIGDSIDVILVCKECANAN
jgi:ribosome-binding protein aMBF1 (putative translation factor)